MKSQNPAQLLRTAISRALLASAAIVPAYLYAPSALAQQAPPQSSFTANEDALGNGLFDMCERLFTSQFPPTPAQFDVFDQCDSFFGGEGSFSSDEHRKTVANALGAFEFNSLRTMSVIFSESQFQSIRDRMRALRQSGNQGSAGLNLRSSEFLVDSGSRLGGGAAADDEALGGDRLGLWMRGNTGSGEKDPTNADGGFDADQSGFTAGVDYRFGSAFVAGASVGYGASELDLNRSGGSGSGIDIDSLALSLYGSTYFGGWYVDAVGNYVSNDYDSERRAQYVDGFGNRVDQTFVGSTSGSTLSVAVAMGYDLAAGGFTFTPSISYQYLDAQIDAFREAGGASGSPGFGMNLAFDEQDYTSSTARVTLDATYAWNLSWGVLIPYVRASYVSEFEDGVEVIGVRFANDPGAAAAQPIVIQSDVIDDSYLRLSAGASVQFKGSVSGYLEYQRIEALSNVDFQDFTIGLRMQF